MKTKLVTICLKQTGEKIRMGTIAAAVLVESQDGHYVKKGSYKRQEKDRLKLMYKAKKKSVFGAKIVRDYKEKQVQSEAEE